MTLEWQQGEGERLGLQIGPNMFQESFVFFKGWTSKLMGWNLVPVVVKAKECSHTTSTTHTKKAGVLGNA